MHADPSSPVTESQGNPPVSGPGKPINITSLLLVAANLVPLVGAIAWGWKVVDIVILYWIENVIVGLLNAVRMACVKSENPGSFDWVAKAFQVGFFFVHYGIFTLVHGVFVFSLFANGGGFDGFRLLPGLLGGPLKWAVLALLASHLVSFFLNYIGQREFEGKDLGEQMAAPYPRMMALHIAIVLGAFAIEAMGQPLIFLVILVIGKTVADLKLHRKSHEKQQAG